MAYSQEFILTKEHRTLLQNAVIRWEDCEFGAPAIDCKRPYGNSSVYEDMCEILNRPVESADYKELRKLHEETEIALQIFLQTGTMALGRYVTTDYSHRWTLVAAYMER